MPRTVIWLTVALTCLQAGSCTRPVSGGVTAVAAPLELQASAYETAGLTALPDVAPLDQAGLHNVYHLSGNIVSGAEPHGEEALAALAAMGIKTVLSVDGKVPDQETASRYGLRYVHVPIQYRGITPDEMLRIAKTFREQEGPFYVHCFHGKHRGPAAAAVGRLVLDGESRDQAIAEMRQWCGTSPRYEGLYRAIAAGHIPTTSETGSYDWDFPAAHALGGFRQVMIGVSRAYDAIEAMAENDWTPPVDHPDLDPLNEAAILVSLMERGEELQEVREKPQDFRDGMVDTREHALAVHAAVAEARSGGSQDWSAVGKAFEGLKTSCNACHAVYRND